MPEPETTESTQSSEGTGARKDKRSVATGGGRELAARADRSLKDVDRLLRKSPQAAPHQKAMARVEQAKVLALLQLAEAIRENRKVVSSST
jgi:hypothetical protein